MNKQKILFSLCFLNLISLHANWFERAMQNMQINKRDLVLVGATIGAVNIGNYLFYRLGSGYKTYTANKLIKKYAVEYSSLNQEYSWLYSEKDLNLNILNRFIDKHTFENFESNILKDLSRLKEVYLELERLCVEHVDNRLIEYDTNKLKISLKKLIGQLTELTYFMNTHRSYYMLEKVYKEVYGKFKKEFILGPEALISQVIMLAKSNDISAAKDYPFAVYVDELIKDLSKLSVAIQKFEQTENENKIVQFYNDAIYLEKTLTYIKECLITLPEYESQVIAYKEVKREEALILEKRRQANAMEEQNLISRKALIAQEEQTRILRDQLFLNRLDYFSRT